MGESAPYLALFEISTCPLPPRYGARNFGTRTLPWDSFNPCVRPSPSDGWPAPRYDLISRPFRHPTRCDRARADGGHPHTRWISDTRTSRSPKTHFFSGAGLATLSSDVIRGTTCVLANTSRPINSLLEPIPSSIGCPPHTALAQSPRCLLTDSPLLKKLFPLLAHPHSTSSNHPATRSSPSSVCHTSFTSSSLIHDLCSYTYPCPHSTLIDTLSTTVRHLLRLSRGRGLRPNIPLRWPEGRDKLCPPEGNKWQVLDPRVQVSRALLLLFRARLAGADKKPFPPAQLG